MNLKAQDGLLKRLGAESIKPKIGRQPSANTSNAWNNLLFPLAIEMEEKAAPEATRSTDPPGAHR